MVLTRSKAAKRDEEIDPGSLTNTAPVKRKADSSMATAPQAKITKTDIAPDLATFKIPLESTLGKVASPITVSTVVPPTPSTTPATVSTANGPENNVATMVSSMITDPAEIDLLLSLIPPSSSTTTTAMPQETQDPILEAVKEPTPVDVPLSEASTTLASVKKSGLPSFPPFSQSTLLAEPSAPLSMTTIATVPSAGSETTASRAALPATALTMPENSSTATTSLPPPPAPMDPSSLSVASMPPQTGQVPKMEDTFVGSGLNDHPLQLLPTSEGDEILALPPPPSSVMEVLRRDDCIQATNNMEPPTAKSMFAAGNGSPDSEAQKKKNETDEDAKGQPPSVPGSARRTTRREKGVRSGVSMIA